MAVGGGRHRVVQQVGPELVPRLVDVVGDEDGGRRRPSGKLDDARLMAVRATFVLVELLQAGLVGLEDEAESVPAARFTAASLPPASIRTARRA